MLCQSYKRMVWQSKLSSRLYNVPYVHSTFTLPSSLRNLAKNNSKEIYDMLFRSAWSCIKKIGGKLQAQLGMVGVLHTWGSDLKYHPHIHCLVTFGGLDKNHEWVWPESTRRLARYEKINQYYTEAFLKNLEQGFKSGVIKYHLNYEEVCSQISRSNWVVNNDWPTENTEVIEDYLAKYINRSAVSKKRLHYDSAQGTVEITYKDYYNQVKGEAAPYLTKKLDPLLAIDKIMQHKLPVGFHRVRYYGLHHSAVERKVKSKIKQSLLRNKDSVQILFELLTKMLNQTNKSSKRICPNCGYDKFDKEKLAGDPNWIYANIVDYSSNKSPPKKKGTNVITTTI